MWCPQFQCDNNDGHWSDQSQYILVNVIVIASTQWMIVVKC